MSSQSAGPSDMEAPLEDFSHCHAGILKHLNQFEELPSLIEPGRRLRQIAEEFAYFFREVVFEHHREEEQELFTAVLASAREGPERERVQQMVKRLTDEHRDVEAKWDRLQPKVKKLIKGELVDLDPKLISDLVAQYKAHASYEEEEFLPLSQEILGRNDRHMAALGLSLHMRRKPLTDLTVANRLARQMKWLGDKK